MSGPIYAENPEYGGTKAVLVEGALRGYRCWRLRHEGLLHSVSVENSWDRGELTATCLSGSLNLPHDPPERSPVQGCTCGIYATHCPGLERGYGVPEPPHVPPSAPNVSIPGVVEAWGQVRLGTRGFRAEHARIVALGIADPTDITVTATEWAWQASPEPEFGLSQRRTSESRSLACSVTLGTGSQWLFGTLVHDYGLPPEDLRLVARQALVSEFQAALDGIMRRYPGVEIFNDQTSMYEKFPPIGVSALLGGQ